MADNINFLQQQQKQFAKRDKGDKWALIAVVGAASIVALIYGSLLYYQINLSKQIEAEKTRQQNLERDILAMSGKESDYLSFYEKLKKISLLSDKRTHATKSLVDTYTYFTTPDTAVVNSIYDYYAKNIELTLSANSVFALEKLINLVQNPEFRQNYQSVEINELTRTASGYYRLNLTLFM